jgi:hypothetical protein
MKKGTIKIGDRIKISDSFIEDWKSKGLINPENEKWYYEIHTVTKVGYEDDKCYPIENLEEYNGIIGDEYVIFDNDEKTYSNTSDDMIII